MSTVDNGEEWRAQVIKALAPIKEGVVYDPTCLHWGEDWISPRTNYAYLEQLKWEQFALASSNVVFFYFGNKHAPVSMLEFGLSVSMGKNIVIYMHPDFPCRGNIEFIQDSYVKSNRRMFVSDNFEKATQQLFIELFQGSI